MSEGQCPGLDLESSGVYGGQGAEFRQQLGVGVQSSQATLLQGDGLRRVLALLGATLAGEVLALNVPESVTVVKPGTGIRTLGTWTQTLRAHFKQRWEPSVPGIHSFPPKHSSRWTQSPCRVC